MTHKTVWLHVIHVHVSWCIGHINGTFVCYLCVILHVACIVHFCHLVHVYMRVVQVIVAWPRQVYIVMHREPTFMAGSGGE